MADKGRQGTKIRSGGLGFAPVGLKCGEQPGHDELHRVEVKRRADWNVSFSRQSGDVVMYVRDTSPPGNSTSATYDSAGTYTFNVPPIRPGHTYYLGINNRPFVSGATMAVARQIRGWNGHTEVFRATQREYQASSAVTVSE